MRASLLLVFLLLGGCAAVAAPQLSQPLYDTDSLLAKQLQEQASGQPQGTSGFFLLASSTEAFVARAELVRAAQRSLDIQYYIVHDGLSTRMLVDEILRAADRNVHVRMLLDDTTSDGKDQQIAILAAHPNIEIRVFNPLHLGRSTAVTRNLGRLFNLSLQHRRMHNKLWLVDGHAAIVGGRNLGDEYFDAKTDLNFTDIDLLGVGPVGRELERSFEEYWNHELSKPIQDFLSNPPTPAALKVRRTELTAELEKLKLENHKQYTRLSRYQRDPQLPGWLNNELIWAHGEAMWDAPDKLLADGQPHPEMQLTTRLAPALEAVSDELILISAYLIPGEEGLKYLSDRARSGVKVSLLTNSLEATDVPAVHGGYAPYRPALLRSGVRLYEMRRQPDEEPSYSYGSSESSLHSKAAIFDASKVFIGSLNFDPRSVLWNTEVGILVDSPKLTAEVRRLTLEGMAPAISYEVRLVQQDGAWEMRWHAENDGQTVVLEREPGGVWRHFNAWFARVIGLERIL
jgi:putative cardiolipin synthase